MNRPDLVSLDDDALAGATNWGLVKRARRELEPRTLSARVDADGADVVVEWSDGPICRFPPHSSVHGICTCGAVGVCRHLVRSLLHLSAHPELLPEVEPPLGELPPPPMTVEDLLKADESLLASELGAKTLQQVRKWLAGGGMEVEVDQDQRSVSFPRLGLLVRLPSQGRIESASCPCSEPQPCPHALAALLLLRGEQPDTRAAASLDAELRSALGRVEQLLGELTRVGLDGLSTAWPDAAKTTAVEVEKVGLEVPARLLRDLADEIRLSFEGRHREGALRWQLAALWFRLLHLKSGAQGEDLISARHVTRWPAGKKRLLGIGGQCWATDRVHGVTAYLMDLASGNIATASTARPVQPYSTPMDLYRGAPVLSDLPCAHLMDRIVELSDSRLSGEGRLSIPPSATCETRKLSAPWMDLIDPFAVRSWSSVADRLRETYPRLVHLGRSPAHWFIPTRWGECKADASGQVLRWMIFDDKESALPIVYEHRAYRKDAFQSLLNFAKEVRPKAVLGRLLWNDGRPGIEPITIIHEWHADWVPYVVDIPESPKEAPRGRRARRTV